MIPTLDIFTELQFLVFLGVASATLSTAALIPYIYDTLQRRTQPQRASWLIWSVLSTVAFFSQLYEGVAASLWFAGVQVILNISVSLLSIWAGKGKYLCRIDYIVIVAALVGILLWFLTESAVYALCISVTISFFGGIPTALKAYRDPDSETLATWVLFMLASSCAALSIGKMDWILLAYPLYLFALSMGVVMAILLGRLRNNNTAGVFGTYTDGKFVFQSE
jgi:hypothetical protein